MKNNDKHLNWKWLTWPPLLTFSIVFIIYFLTSFIKLDPDFGWHLKSGEYFIKNGIPEYDIFTYTAANFPWINHEWLSDVFVATLHSLWGYIGLSAVFAGLWTLSIWLVGRKVHNLLIIVAVISTLPFSGVRAITWSVLGVATLITLISAKNRNFRWLIPLLFVLWVNVHGSFFVGLALLLYFVVKERSWRLATLLGLCILLSFVNPYGPSIYIEIWRTIADGSVRWQIAEWKPFYIPWLTMLFFFTWSSAFILTDLKNWRKYLGVDMIAFLAGVSANRNLVLFVILSLAITGQRLKAVAATIPRDLDKPRRLFVVISWITIAAVFLGITIWSYWGVSTNRESFYPQKAVSYLKDNPCRGNLFNDYNYGGYLIWKLPEQKVYIDGRMPCWELDGRKYMDEYVDIRNKPEIRAEIFEKYGITCTLVEKKSKKLIADLKKHGWKSVVDDGGSILLISP